jgi:hypothetical protein
MKLWYCVLADDIIDEIKSCEISESNEGKTTDDKSELRNEAA